MLCRFARDNDFFTRTVAALLVVTINDKLQNLQDYILRGQCSRSRFSPQGIANDTVLKQVWPRPDLHSGSIKEMVSFRAAPFEYYASVLIQ